VFTALAITALVLASPTPAEPSLAPAELSLAHAAVAAVPLLDGSRRDLQLPRTLTPAEALVEGVLYRVAVVKPMLVAGLPRGSRLFLVVVPVEGHTVLQAVGSW
jgi:hypothetical protein